MAPKRSRNWVFTLNNYTAAELAEWHGHVQDCTDDEHKTLAYVVFGQEVGESGTPHLQGYIRCKSAKSMAGVRTCYSQRAHWEPRKGTHREASEYSKKEGNFQEGGTEPMQGIRPDLDNYRMTAVEYGIREVSATGNMQQIRVAEKFLTYNEVGRVMDGPAPTILWYYGRSGSGKTREAQRFAQDEYPDDVYWKDNDSKWFDGYDGHKVVIFDDFRSANFKLNVFLKLLDRYPVRVEYKGGMRQYKPVLVIVTSIHHPSTFYNIDGEPREQLLRRINTITHFGGMIRG